MFGKNVSRTKFMRKCMPEVENMFSVLSKVPQWDKGIIGGLKNSVASVGLYNDKGDLIFLVGKRMDIGYGEGSFAFVDEYVHIDDKLSGVIASDRFKNNVVNSLKEVYKKSKKVKSHANVIHFTRDKVLRVE